MKRTTRAFVKRRNAEVTFRYFVQPEHSLVYIGNFALQDVTRLRTVK